MSAMNATTRRSNASWTTLPVAMGPTSISSRPITGSEKTHFIGMVNALALDKNWVTSYVTLSKEQGVRLDKFEQLYAAILRNCVCRGLLESRQNAYDPGEINGWTWILDDWIQRHLQAEAKSAD